jgi:predicted lipoprotein with Yx(FWY)xxD motif
MEEREEYSMSGTGRARKVIAGFLLTLTVAGMDSVVVAPQASAAGAATVKVSDTLAGSVITNARGYVLMTFPKGGHKLTLCLQIKACLADWPPVTTTGKPVAGPGLNPELLGTITYKNKLRVVTYNGWPLHTYKFAYSAQSSVINIGIKQFGGPWYALDANGKIVR